MITSEFWASRLRYYQRSSIRLIVGMKRCTECQSSPITNPTTSVPMSRSIVYHSSDYSTIANRETWLPEGIDDTGSEIDSSTTYPQTPDIEPRAKMAFLADLPEIDIHQIPEYLRRKSYDECLKTL